jgi:hypothetical protein
MLSFLDIFICVIILCFCYHFVLSFLDVIRVITFRSDKGSNAPRAIIIRSDNGPKLTNATTIRNDNGSDVPRVISEAITFLPQQ